MTADGLVVLDRLKDVINAHGRAIHAIDVETAALGMADGSVLAAAAFAAASAEGEVLVLLCEVATADHTHGALRDLAARLSQGVGRSCGLLPRLEFVTRGALPRTSNGKIRRQAARQAFLAGDVRLLGNPAGHDG
jgi:acyl-CoA synthetase (AMP-forming)/AMP-acid ligase II